MTRCNFRLNGCAQQGSHLVRRGSFILRACGACAPIARRSTWVKQVRDGTAYDRGEALQGYEWSRAPEPRPWDNDDDDPRTDEEKAQSLERLTGDPVVRHWQAWE